MNYTRVPLPLVLLPLVLITACDGPPTQTPTDNFARQAMLENLADHVILPTLRTFADDTRSLNEAAARGDREATRTAWKDAMATWERAELFQVGPAGPAGIATGGTSLRDEIYSWPAVNPCAVDQQLVANDFGDASFTDDKLIDVYGLDAIEYLLFTASAENECAGPATINQDGSWAALAAGDLDQRRLDYVANITDDLAGHAAALVAAWEDGFRDELVNAGEDSAFPSAQAAIDEVFAGLFYIELVTKDKKVAIPAGLRAECASTVCPDKVESRWAFRSNENIGDNLRAVRAMFLGLDDNGADGVSFDDFLRELGADELADRMIEQLNTAIFAADALDGPLQHELAENPASVIRLHDAIKDFTDSMKSEMVSVLNLRVPQEGDGDND